MSTAAVFWEIEKAFDTTWHLGLIYKLSKLHFLVNLLNFVIHASRNTSSVPQGSVLAPILYNLYRNDASQTPGLQLALFPDDMCMYAIDRKELFSQKPGTRHH